MIQVLNVNKDRKFVSAVIKLCLYQCTFRKASKLVISIPLYTSFILLNPIAQNGQNSVEFLPY